MILCLCRAVSDREVDTVIRQGAQTVDAVGQMCGAGTDCGSCIDSIEERLCRTTGAKCAGPQARGHGEHAGSQGHSGS